LLPVIATHPAVM